MGKYETLMHKSPVPVDDSATLPENIKGIYIETQKAGVILVNKNIPTTIEKTCILAEELGHYYTSSGDITDQTDIRNRKQERRARAWAYEKLVPLSAFVDAHKMGIRNRHELAEHLDVIEDFLEQAIIYYKEKYGLFTIVGKYTICFEPLGVLERLE